MKVNREIKVYYRYFLYPIICWISAYRNNRSLIMRYGGENLNLKKLKNLKKSNKLFILGTGQSINNLSDENWEEIKSHDSFGFNDFCLKNFSTTFYSIELERQEDPDFRMRWERNAIHIEKVNLFKETQFLLRPYDLTTPVLTNFVKFLRGQRFQWHLVHELPGIRSSEIFRILNFYIKTGFSRSNFYFPSRGSSLSWILFLAHKLGYEEIILCGIDLQGQHFWQNHLPVSKVSDDVVVHETAIGTNGIGIEEIIDVYQKTIFKNCKLYVGTEFSRLYGKLPKYFKI